MHPSLFFRPGALLSQPELSAARIDGVLIEVGEGYMPPDLPEDAGARATSLTPIVPDGYALCGPTAAWVHGVRDAPPSCHHLQRISPRRPRISPARNVVVHERLIGADEFEFIAGMPVTTPLRTLTDLVLESRGGAETDRWMRSLAAAAPALVPQVHALLAARERMPGKRAALARLTDLAGYDEVTR